MTAMEAVGQNAAAAGDFVQLLFWLFVALVVAAVVTAVAVVTLVVRRGRARQPSAGSPDGRPTTR